jgi:hypothetical protein
MKSSYRVLFLGSLLCISYPSYTADRPHFTPEKFSAGTITVNLAPDAHNPNHWNIHSLNSLLDNKALEGLYAGLKKDEPAKDAPYHAEWSKKIKPIHELMVLRDLLKKDQ